MTQQQASYGFWRAAGKRLWADKLARFCMAVLVVYFLVAGAAGMGWVAKDWNEEVGVSYANPSFLGDDYPNPQGKNSIISQDVLVIDEKQKAVDPLAPYYEEIEKNAAAYEKAEVKPSWTLPLGGDKWGRDVFDKVIKAGQVSISIGLASALLAVFIGTVLGALGGYFGGKLGDLLEWFYNIFTSVPYILLVLAFAAVFGKGVSTVILVLGFVGWTGTYRLIRAEYIKQRGRDYVMAANAIGASHGRKMFVHILPNVSHLILVQLSQLVVDFIKAEVILSFLGLGVPTDSVSWGIMINEVMPELVLGKWWQLATVAVVMSTFVVSFGLFTDLLRDALDPKASRR
ncbi:ABC transporter permease [Chitinimonas prasina]|uniref:ABC transporter permease n=1 Tax=Chitinimonas prasina TaxID=1434937 RepID=A0ABQ5YGW3_9NEIS|nr:ABC transporter permease [Chitinimonas prasina]GLR14252.1 ABC transporter permease [Chitinimonas prasina]